MIILMRKIMILTTMITLPEYIHLRTFNNFAHNPSPVLLKRNLHSILLLNINYSFKDIK